MVRADQYFVVSYVILFTLILLTVGVNILSNGGKPELAQSIFRRSGFAAVPLTVAMFWYLSIA